ncbi:MAG TPA: carboxypeptidase-like regulatory domain-containing protein [Terriglobales bacterium]|nr:carboxypeptidase-like regulatory domain-containing protein [Terriglobales bacterium]
MKRSHTIAICAFVMVLLAVPGAFAKNKDTTPGRLLTGKVLDRQDNAVVDAVVYVTDTRTRAVKTYIVGPDGTYRFPALATNVDYEIYAQSKGKTSDTKRMSQFDDRKVVDILLRIDTR